MYYKTRNSEICGFVFLTIFLVLIVFHASWFPFKLLIFLFLCGFWFRYFFWVLQTRHLKVWFGLEAPAHKSEEADWLCKYRSNVSGRIKAKEGSLNFPTKVLHKSAREYNQIHLKEMQDLALRFGFEVRRELEYKYE